MLVVRQKICSHKGVKSEEASGVTGLFPQTFPNQRGPAWSASNTLNITGMPGEVRAHGVTCHFPSCHTYSRLPIRILALRGGRKTTAEEGEAVMMRDCIMSLPSPSEARSQALIKDFSSSFFLFLTAIFLPTVTANIRIGCVDQVWCVPCHFPSCPIPGFAPVGHASQERSARMKVLLQQLSGEHDGRDVPFLLS